jgi:hypothetical protein
MVTIVWIFLNFFFINYIDFKLIHMFPQYIMNVAM